jgi:hypothetical protein
LKNLNLWDNAIIFFLLLGFVFIIANSFSLPFERDEGHYAYGAWIMTRGLVPYINTFEQKPPLIFLPYLLAYLINPQALWPAHLLADIFLLFTLLLIGMVAAREYGKRVGLLAMWLGLLLVMTPHLAPFAANTERFLILPLMGLLAIYVFNRDCPGRWPLFWGTVCGVSAILFKQISLVPVSFILTIWLIERKKLGTIKDLLTITVAALLTGFLTCGYFLMRGAAPFMWENLVVFNRYYMQATGGFTLQWFLFHLRQLTVSWVGIYLLIIWFVCKKTERRWFYLGLLLVSGLSILTTPYGHYYIALAPFLAIIAAAGIDTLSRQLAESLKIAGKEKLVFVILSVMVVFSLFWPVRNYYVMPAPELLTRVYSTMNPFVESPLVAKRIDELTKPNDYIYIAGTEMQLHYYSKRLNPSRFSGVYSLMINQPLNLKYQQETIADLEKKTPRVIIWVQSPFSWLVQPGTPTLIFNYLHRQLAQHYRLVGGSLRSWGQVAWEEPVEKNRMMRYSILLFIRK